MSVYKSICAVQTDLAHVGISKDKRNSQQGYSFRGIDDVYNTLSPLLAKHGLCILPRMLSRSCEERQTAKGGVLFYVTVDAEFDFVCADDGSKHTVKTYGEAMDSADKATNKAMSAAYKYAAFQAFAIPTEGDNDADSSTHEIRPQPSNRHTPVKAAMQSVQIDAEQAEYLRNLAAELVNMVEVEGKPEEAYELLSGSRLDSDDKVFLWDVLAPNSKTRSAIKKEGDKLKSKETA